MTSPPPVTYTYTAHVPHPAHVAYAWLTDYRDDDPALTSAIVQRRRVVRRTPEEVVLDTTIENLGKEWSGLVTVQLFPGEHRWVATLREGKLVNRYALTPTPEGCLFTVEYRVYARRWTRRVLLRLARRRVHREAAAMWKGFLAAMDKELATAPTP